MEAAKSPSSRDLERGPISPRSKSQYFRRQGAGIFGRKHPLRAATGAWTADEDLADEEAQHKQSATATVASFAALTFSSLGIVYGDLGTSPLYLWPNVFVNIGPPSHDQVVGALSLVFWTLTLIFAIKYALIVMYADDHGEGGTFALYSLLCRYLQVSPTGEEASEDRQLKRYATSYHGLLARKGSTLGVRLRGVFHKSAFLQKSLLLLVLLGTCALIGDGVLTPAISVVSAISGLQVPDALLDIDGNPKVSNGVVVGVSCAILFLIFLGQQLGTEKIGFTYAPILAVYFVSNAAIGIYNVATNDAYIFKALSPHYGIKYLIDNGITGWRSLGGIVLCITGTEALFADMGHFSRGTIQVSALGLVYPSLFLIYFGQGSFLLEHPEAFTALYFKAIPKPIYWPIFIIATLATIVASQSIVSGTFSIISQSITLNCFPRVKVVHTSAKIVGQVYIPEINWLLCALGIACILGFTLTQDPTQPVNTIELGYAFGVAVLAVMMVTTLLITLVMLVVWRMRLVVALSFFILYACIEGVYFSANLEKVPTGGWVPLVIAACFTTVSLIWHWGTLRRARWHAKHKLELSGLLRGVGPDGAPTRSVPTLFEVVETGVKVPRIPGLALIYSDSLASLPTYYQRLLRTSPVVHDVVIFLTLRQVTVPRVDVAERMLIKRLEYPGFFRVVARYGYAEPVDQGPAFVEALLLQCQLELQCVIGEIMEAKNAISVRLNNPSAGRRFVSLASSEALGGTAGGPGAGLKEPIESHTPGRFPVLPTVEEAAAAASLVRDMRRSVSERRPEISPAPDGPPETPPRGPPPASRPEALNDVPKEASRLLEELSGLEKAKKEMVVYFRSRSVVMAPPESPWYYKLALEKLYGTLTAISRRPLINTNVPLDRLLEIGQLYYVD